MTSTSLPRPRASRCSRRGPRRSALQGGDVILDLPVHLGVAGKLLVEIGEALLHLGAQFVDLSTDLRVKLGDRFQDIFERGLGHLICLGLSDQQFTWKLPIGSLIASSYNLS